MAREIRAFQCRGGGFGVEEAGELGEEGGSLSCTVRRSDLVWSHRGAKDGHTRSRISVREASVRTSSSLGLGGIVDVELYWEYVWKSASVYKRQSEWCAWTGTYASRVPVFLMIGLAVGVVPSYRLMSPCRVDLLCYYYIKSAA